MNKRDYYEVLVVPRGAGVEEIEGVSLTKLAVFATILVHRPVLSLDSAGSFYLKGNL